MARKNTADIAKAKAGKQKKIAIGLGCVLALAMAYAVHTMMALGGDKSALPQAAVTTPGSTTPASAPVPAVTTAAPPAAPTLSGSEPSAASPLSSPLISAVRPPADAGQLESFSRFESKDPFNASGPSSSTPSSGSGSSGSSGGTGSGAGTPPKTPPAPPAAPTPAPTTAVISVNGVSESVTSGGAFPAANPLFQLISLTSKSAKVTVVGGSYASGSPALTLTVSRPVTLQNTADGTRYTLVLMPQGTVAPAAPVGISTSPASSTPPASTPPTTTTTGG